MSKQGIYLDEASIQTHAYWANELMDLDDLLTSEMVKYYCEALKLSLDIDGMIDLTP